VTHAEVHRVFAENNQKLRDLIFEVIPELPAERDCPCATALSEARVET
jgi:5'-methylthioadenosine phosphorylase